MRKVDAKKIREPKVKLWLRLTLVGLWMFASCWFASLALRYAFITGFTGFTSVAAFHLIALLTVSGIWVWFTVFIGRLVSRR